MNANSTQHEGSAHVNSSDPRHLIESLPSWRRLAVPRKNAVERLRAYDFPEWPRFEICNSSSEAADAKAHSRSVRVFETPPRRTRRTGARYGSSNSRAWCMALAAFATLGFASFAAQASEKARGDVAWAERAVGAQDDRPDRFQVLESVNAYTNAVLAWPDDLEARWKLLRSLHFAGDFAAEDAIDRSRSFERARSAAEVGITRLAETIGGGERLDEMKIDEVLRRLESADASKRDVARLYFWSAINWGAWSRDIGAFRAVREGVANRIHRYASVTAELEPDYEDGGALRLLGTLHANLPRVPFISGWVDRDRSIPLLERAYAMDPTHPGNTFLLATTLLELSPARRDEAIVLLQQVEALPPREEMRIEDGVIRRQARERLESVDEGKTT